MSILVRIPGLVSNREAKIQFRLQASAPHRRRRKAFQLESRYGIPLNGIKIAQVSLIPKAQEKGDRKREMKKGLLQVALFSLAGLLIGACAPALKETRPGEIADPYFRPKRVYALDFNQAWDLTLKALSREGISLRASNRETGLIQTDYTNVSAQERNRCALRCTREPYRKTFVHILCRREARTEMNEPFRDITYTSPLEAMKAEENLYRKIEPYLLPAERSPRVQQEMIAKGELSPAAVPVVPAALFGKENPGAVPLLRTSAAAQTSLTSPAAVNPHASPVHSNGAAPEPAPVPLVKAASEEKPRIAYVSTIEAANARKAPSTQGPLLTVLKKGERAERVGVSGIWTKVRLLSGEVVWIHGDFLKEVDSGEASSGIFSAEAARNNGSPRPVKENPAAARDKVPPVSPVKTESPAGGTAESSKMNLETRAITRMRAEPSSNSKVVLVLKKGRAVEKIGESGEYSKVKLSWGDTGWVLNRSLKSR